MRRKTIKTNNTDYNKKTKNRKNKSFQKRGDYAKTSW